DEADASSEAAPALSEDDDDSEAGRRRRRGRRGGRRMREDGAADRDAFFWVRGRTPSLDDPYVWFDPINPERTPAPASSAMAADVEDRIGERPDGERAE